MLFYRYIAYIFGILLVVHPFLYMHDSRTGNEDIVFLTAFVILGILLSMTLVRLFNRKHASGERASKIFAKTYDIATITTVDFAVSVYLFYGVLNILLVRHTGVDILWSMKWVAFLGGYVVVRTMPDKRPIAYALIVSGIIQSIIAIGQQNWWIDSNHIHFQITGSFGNPGQLGGYLAICFVAALGLNITKTVRKNKIGVVIGTFAIAIIAYGLILADSRAGWLAALVGAGIYFMPNTKLWSAKCKSVFFVTMTTIMACLCVLLFLYRPDSVRARMLTWRVSTDMISDVPILGHGIGTFNDHYMLYQAEYFNAHPDSEYLSVADNIQCPYNELLHIGTEQGVIGMLLVLIIFGTALYGCKSSRNLFKAALLSLIVFAMFSYPANVFPLMFLFAALSGAAAGKPLGRFRVDNAAWVSGTTLCIVMLIITGYGYVQYSKISNRIYSLYTSDTYNTANIEAIRADYPAFRNNRILRDTYLSWLAEHTSDDSDLPYIADITPVCESYVMIGDAFLRLNRHIEAERYYKIAASMIPTRMTPNYRLWKLYCEIGDTVQSINSADKVLTQHLKAENTLNIQLRAEVKAWLERRE